MRKGEEGKDGREGRTGKERWEGRTGASSILSRMRAQQSRA